MNYLAHAFLSPPSEEILLGNIACDMIRPGDNDSLSPGVRDGMALHQRIDRFTDSHSSFKKIRTLITSGGIPYGGVLADIINDHFLALHWEEYSSESLNQFSVRIYEILGRRAAVIPGRFPKLAGHLCAEDWFGEFRTEKGLENALLRVNYRSSREIPAAAVMKLVRERRNSFEREFHTLMTRLAEVFLSSDSTELSV